MSAKKIAVLSVILLLSVSLPLSGKGSVRCPAVNTDSALVWNNTGWQQPDDSSSVNKRGFIERVKDYFKESNTEKQNKRFDFSVIGGPHYSSDTKLGLGLVAAGFYRKNLADSLTTPSNVSLYGDISTVGFWLIGIRGDHIFPHDRQRLDYNMYFYSFPRHFWGIGYGAGSEASDYTDFRELYLRASVDYLFKIGRAFYIGPAAEFQRSVAKDITPENLYRWNGEKLNCTNAGIGFRLQYDSRDNLTAATSGFYCALEQRYFPSFAGNMPKDFGYSELSLRFYRGVWKGGVLAGAYHARLSYGDVPWSQLSTFGGSSTMRGYYEGRFRDKGEMDITFELRQHVYRRNGLAVWAGAGTVFPRFSAMRFRHILPNAGIGYRWEFKSRTNVRVDFGVGRGETAFIFSINEAF